MSEEKIKDLGWLGVSENQQKTVSLAVNPRVRPKLNNLIEETSEELGVSKSDFIRDALWSAIASVKQKSEKDGLSDLNYLVLCDELGLKHLRVSDGWRNKKTFLLLNGGKLEDG